MICIQAEIGLSRGYEAPDEAERHRLSIVDLESWHVTVGVGIDKLHRGLAIAWQNHPIEKVYLPQQLRSFCI